MYLKTVLALVSGSRRCSILASGADRGGRTGVAGLCRRHQICAASYKRVETPFLSYLFLKITTIKMYRASTKYKKRHNNRFTSENHRYAFHKQDTFTDDTFTDALPLYQWTDVVSGTDPQGLKHPAGWHRGEEDAACAANVSHIVYSVSSFDPLLEAFESAETVRSNGSSRFAKCVLAGGLHKAPLLEESQAISCENVQHSCPIFCELRESPAAYCF
uniref:Uncharacterized protein n=1 Tax=Corethron hystrix TaxID=216773 RepID=A0A7S1BQH3_9STRA|mmetsp:Transcript_37427/g.87283  ORF Transcript_37427/g.87283 Transcript_37427/m.87283 type:complete len:217 (+) Transcript_37427:706-1356(+)